ncbi:unnamed protein product [Soboliphyme baturini]|uniref:AMMECR1 domain-containing protein n=1 Tax=Soboliphyme baturini TaxID=241478 RepID=A0A183IBB5_9BILA|nr:unnamed protein product [Soboliphyme baturini]
MQLCLGWNQVQTIDSLLRKGGFRGHITPEVRNSICLVRFQSEKMSVSYAEYMAYKQEANQYDRVNVFGVYSLSDGGHTHNGLPGTVVSGDDCYADQKPSNKSEYCVNGRLYQSRNKPHSHQRAAADLKLQENAVSCPLKSSLHIHLPNAGDFSHILPRNNYTGPEMQKRN